MCPKAVVELFAGSFYEVPFFHLYLSNFDTEGPFPFGSEPNLSINLLSEVNIAIPPLNSNSI